MVNRGARTPACRVRVNAGNGKRVPGSTSNRLQLHWPTVGRSARAARRALRSQPGKANTIKSVECFARICNAANQSQEPAVSKKTLAFYNLHGNRRSLAHLPCWAQSSKHRGN